MNFLTPEQIKEVERVVQSVDALGELLASQGQAMLAGRAQTARAMIRYLASRLLPPEKKKGKR